MPDITMTRQTNLRGTALQNAVNTMVSNMGRRSPFNIVPLQTRWESATRMVLSGSALGQQQVSGAIDIRDGSPSTVTAQINLLTSTSRGYASQVETAMVEESDRALQPVASSSSTSAQTAAQTSTQTSAQRTSGASWDQWNLTSNILGDIFGGAAAGLDAFNQQMGYAAAQEAVQVASQEAQNAGVSSGKATPAPAPRPSIVTTPQQAPAPVVTAASFPTWGWVLLGLGGAGLVAFIIYTGVTKHG